MIQTLLSILIPLTPERKNIVHDLLRKFGAFIGLRYMADDGEWVQYTSDEDSGIEIIICHDNKILTIGEKREKLYSLARGLFSWQIDSDDNISDNAIELILNAIKSNPEVDCITFRERCMMNGEYKTSNHSLKYSQWMDRSDGFDYVRSPFYKDVIRTDIAKSVPFEHIRFNEDERWSKALYPNLHTEIHINEELYYYIYNPKESHEIRYGIK